MELKDDLKQRLSEMAYGDIQVVAMVDRGPYRESDPAENADTATGASQLQAGIFAELAVDLKADNEDLITVQRKDQHTAMLDEDVDWFLSALTADKHIVFLQCLELGTTEIKNFLYTLKEKGFLAQSKVFLLDLPQLEYMTLRDSLLGKIKL